MGAALIEGAPLATQDIAVWFAGVDDARIVQAAKDAGGFWISGFGVQPPAFGGDGLSRVDVVLTAHGLDAFDVEYERALARTADGAPLRGLPLARVIASRRSTGRVKDPAQLPALEARLLARDKTNRR